MTSSYSVIKMVRVEKATTKYKNGEHNGKCVDNAAIVYFKH